MPRNTAKRPKLAVTRRGLTRKSISTDNRMSSPQHIPLLASRTECPKNATACLTNKSPPKLKQCSVPIDDVFIQMTKLENKIKLLKTRDLCSDASSNISKFEIQLANMQSSQDSLISLIDQLLPLGSLLKLPNLTDLKSAHAVGSIVDHIATEINKRLNCRKNAIVFNIPDRLSLTSVKKLLLGACHMSACPCYCTRLRKKLQKNCCPILFEFRDEYTAKSFIYNCELIASNTSFKSINIVTDRTSLQRASQQNDNEFIPPKAVIHSERIIPINNNLNNGINLTEPGSLSHSKSSTNNTFSKTPSTSFCFGLQQESLENASHQIKNLTTTSPYKPKKNNFNFSSANMNLQNLPSSTNVKKPPEIEILNSTLPISPSTRMYNLTSSVQSSPESVIVDLDLDTSPYFTTSNHSIKETTSDLQLNNLPQPVKTNPRHRYTPIPFLLSGQPQRKYAKLRSPNKVHPPHAQTKSTCQNYNALHVLNSGTCVPQRNFTTTPSILGNQPILPFNMIRKEHPAPSVYTPNLNSNFLPFCPRIPPPPLPWINPLQNISSLLINLLNSILTLQPTHRI
jgi:hypothetical protein